MKSTVGTIETSARCKPILFRAAMVNAILAGRKTQTRRVVKPQPPKGWEVQFPGPASTAARHVNWMADGFKQKRWGDPIKCPYGGVGDWLWVKEQWMVNLTADREARRADKVRYRATDNHASSDGMGWRSPLFMPKWAARLWLEITDVRVERVQEINEADAEAEGVDATCSEREWLGNRSHPRTFRCGYEILWDRINGKTHPWKSNPWVWIITFNRSAKEASDK